MGEFGTFIIVISFLLFAYHFFPSKRLIKTIPGPRQLPIIGNIGQVDPNRQHPMFLSWAKKYGPIYKLRFGSNRFIVLNTAKASIDLLDRRSSIYSSRSGPHFAHDLMSQGQRMVFLEYGKKWKVRQPF